MKSIGQLTLDSTYDEVAQALIGEMAGRDYTQIEAIGVVSSLIQESRLNPRARNGPWEGIAQQDSSYPGRGNANTQITGFLDRLDTKRESPGHGDIWGNIFWLQQRPSEASAEDAWNDRDARRAYMTEIKQHTDEAARLVNKYWNGAAVPTTTLRPDFNEINQIGWDAADPHGSGRSQPPKNWFIHTQEGDGNAEQLAAFLRSTKGVKAVSYHYTVHEDPNDHGVTVCDVIDTDLYSWSVLNANVFSINGCFAGSYAADSRDVWLAKRRNAIRVMAYLAVEDARKYPTIAANVIAPPYLNTGSGISDHRYVTQALKIGNHTDVGGPMQPPWDGFPWDVFEADVKSLLVTPKPGGPGAPPPSVDTTPVFSYPSVEIMVRETWEQVRGIEGKGWPQLGKDDKGRDRTQVDGLAALLKKEGLA